MMERNACPNTNSPLQGCGYELQSQPETPQNPKADSKCTPKRPMNSFMVWSSIERKRLAERHPTLCNTSLSKLLGEKWHSMSNEEKEPFCKEADRLKAKLMEQKPDYKYRPRRRKLNSLNKSLWVIGKRAGAHGVVGQDHINVVEATPTSPGVGCSSQAASAFTSYGESTSHLVQNEWNYTYATYYHRTSSAGYNLVSPEYDFAYNLPACATAASELGSTQEYTHPSHTVPLTNQLSYPTAGGEPFPMPYFEMPIADIPALEFSSTAQLIATGYEQPSTDINHFMVNTSDHPVYYHYSSTPVHSGSHHYSLATSRNCIPTYVYSTSSISGANPSIPNYATSIPHLGGSASACSSYQDSSYPVRYLSSDMSCTTTQQESQL